MESIPTGIPPELLPLLLLQCDVMESPDRGLRGLVMRCGHGSQRYLVTRQQLLDMSTTFQAAAEAMLEPS